MSIICKWSKERSAPTLRKEDNTKGKGAASELRDAPQCQRSWYIW